MHKPLAGTFQGNYLAPQASRQISNSIHGFVHGFPLALALYPSGFRNPQWMPSTFQGGIKKKEATMFHMMPSPATYVAYHAILSQEAQ